MDYLLSLQNENNTADNERYTNIEEYIDNSVKKFKNLIKIPNSSKSSYAKTEANSEINK